MSKVIFWSTDAKLIPEKKHLSDAGWDLKAACDFIVRARSRIAVDTGVIAAIEEGYYGRILPRSGLALKGLDTKVVWSIQNTGEI